MKKKILFVGNGSFKNLSDTYWRIEYLKNNYEITYLGFKEGLINNSIGFRLIELDGFGNSILSRFKLLLNYYRLTKTTNFDLNVINYFVGVFLFSFVSGRKFVDIRSSTIKYYFVSRFFFNLLLKFESSFFKKKIVISDSLRKFLNLNTNNTIIFPLGSTKFNLTLKTFEYISLLYIGTFNFRRIHETIEGYAQFRIENPGILLKFYIIGFGSFEETSNLKSFIKKFDLEKEIIFVGELRYPEFLKYFELCNVGVSYIPITDYFDCQPPTKTFEYLVNGFSVIATATYENKQLINSSNGVLIQDSALGFKRGLEELIANKSFFNSKCIIENSSKFTWQNIVNTYTEHLFEE